MMPLPSFAAHVTACMLMLLQTVDADAPLQLSVLSWNVHWQCGSNHLQGCRAAATKRLAELAKSHSVDMVVAIELEHNDTEPIDLPSHGLGTAWWQMNGSCPADKAGASGDALALAIHPAFDTGWTPVVKSFSAGNPTYAIDGGCLGGDSGGSYNADARAFVVALLDPPEPSVKGCEAGVCFIALHAPHIDITKGADKVARVCGESRHHCTVAVGDWNAPISKQSFCNFTVADRWSQLLGEPPSGARGSGSLVGAPDENTCCFPESKYHGWDDHLVTNIRGASVSATVLDYQMVSFGSDTEEHKPIIVSVTLPNPCSDNATDPDVCAPARYGSTLCYNKQTDACCENSEHGTSILCPVGGTGGCCIGGARASRIQFCCNETATCCAGDYFSTPGSCCSASETCCPGMGACCAAGTTCCYAPISIGADQPAVGTCCGAFLPTQSLDHRETQITHARYILCACASMCDSQSVA